jgi:hypothetical protein
MHSLVSLTIYVAKHVSIPRIDGLKLMILSVRHGYSKVRADVVFGRQLNVR